MLNPKKYLIVCFFTLILFSCSDGSQIGLKMNELIKKHKVTTVTIQNECSGSEPKSKTFKIKKLKIEQQFIEVDSLFINMGKIRTITVDGKELKIVL